MPDNNPPQPINPQALRLEDLARILTASGPKPVSVQLLQADIKDGASVNPDGTVSLVNYAAWLVKETLHVGY